MKHKKYCFIFVFALSVLMIVCNTSASPLAGDKVKDGTKIIKKAFGMQLPFITNNGQTHKNVSFYAKTFGGTLYVTKKGEMVYALPRASKVETTGAEKKIARDKKRDVWVLKESLLGAHKIHPQGIDRAETKVSCFKGNDKEKWQSDIPTYNGLLLGRVYDGIEFSLKAQGKNVEKIFTVYPSGRVNDIKFKIEGASSMKSKKNGDLEMETDLGPVTFSAPIAYQRIDGKQKSICAAYDVKGKTYGFKVGEYDPNHPLIIDPVLASTFIGGTATDFAYAAVLDSLNNIYITGYTESSDFPTTVSHGGYWGVITGIIGPPSGDWGYDVFVAKLSKDFTSLLAATYIGGSGYNEYSHSIALDTDGNVYITGSTDSDDIDDFPTTTVAYDKTHNGRTDAFVCKLSNTLSGLQASTLIGGSGHDTAYSITVKPIDNDNRIYISGYTTSSDFPTRSGAYDQEFNNGADVFVARFNSTLGTLEKSTFVGGTANEHGFAIAVDDLYDVWVTGWTNSSNFPTTPGAYDERYNSGEDVFILRLNKDLDDLEAATYIGGTGDEKANDIKMSPLGRIYITGRTESVNFPTTSGGYDESGHSEGEFINEDIFVSSFNSDLTVLSASTYLGGTGNDEAHELTFDPLGNVYLAGETTSQDFPTTAGAYDRRLNLGGTGSDAFVSKLTSDLTQLSRSTFLGEIFYDGAVAVALDGVNTVYVVGATQSDDFPVTSSAYDGTWDGYNDVFVSKLDADLSSGATPPMVIQKTPDVNAIGVADDASIYAEFTTQMAPETITASTFLVNDGTANIPGLVLFEGATARFAPAGDLKYSHTYTVRITTAVTDLSGTPMAHDCIWTFQTIGLGNHPPDKPILVSPVNETKNVSLMIELQAGDFFDSDSLDTHSQTRWQISKLLDFSLLVLDVTVNNQSQGITLTVPESLLEEGTTYYWRALFLDNHGSGSQWSDPYRFTTMRTSKKTIADILLSLKLIAGMDPNQTVYDVVDVDGDEKITLTETIYFLQKISGLKP